MNKDRIDLYIVKPSAQIRAHQRANRDLIDRYSAICSHCKNNTPTGGCLVMPLADRRLMLSINSGCTEAVVEHPDDSRILQSGFIEMNDGRAVFTPYTNMTPRQFEDGHRERLKRLFSD